MAVVHKTELTGTEVHTKGRRRYKRADYHAMCRKPVSQFERGEVMSPYDEDVTCPDCLTKLGGRRQSNRDVMAAADEIKKFNYESMLESWNR